MYPPLQSPCIYQSDGASKSIDVYPCRAQWSELMMSGEAKAELQRKSGLRLQKVMHIIEPVDNFMHRMCITSFIEF
eukprot:2078898-Karenia_brevis.AAC.1